MKSSSRKLLDTAKTGLRMDEQVIDRQSAAIDQYSNVYDQPQHVTGLHGVDQQNKRDDQYQIICQKAQQLPAGVAPVWTKQAVEEVEGVSEKDTTKDDGRIGVQIPGEYLLAQDQGSACEKERGDEDPERNADRHRRGTRV